ncbi:AAA family ATPase [Myxococcus sp. K15C18031901]|uniref:AAA family ATPase n=1 Tax=Myxococcus dinghuensis TaxID=2906761 RepID=UPI0020A7B366|nr:ATP-binding protein [Myxococcus dinghuensis]MCP3104120.1 AAA family ATPase [Myxococcus dinghuensis]
MLTSATIENFRGIERLQVEGLGRVNLIIGRNDSGKTALMEALQMLWDLEDAGFVLFARQAARHPDTKFMDFDDFWLPIFRRMDARRGFRIGGTDSQGKWRQLAVAKAPTATFAVQAPEEGVGAEARTSWALDWTMTHGQTSEVRMLGSDGKSIRFPTLLKPPEGRTWINPSPSVTATDIRTLSRLKQQGRGDAVVSLLRLINERVSGVELLAPTGERATVFVRLEHDGLLPLSMMGEGAKRSFELAIALASEQHPVLCIDEVENGLHHSTLESLAVPGHRTPPWRWVTRVGSAPISRCCRTPSGFIRRCKTRRASIRTMLRSTH